CARYYDYDGTPFAYW
nr:immunoglobulin heavy chain junction region [Mus musculus]